MAALFSKPRRVCCTTTTVVLCLCFAAAWRPPSVRVSRPLKAAPAVARPQDSAPSWLTPPATPPVLSERGSSSPVAGTPPLDSRPAWLAPKAPEHQDEPTVVVVATSPPPPSPAEGAVQRVPTTALSRAYGTSALVWLGASVDACRAADWAVAGSFVLAATAAQRLAAATKARRLASSTYRRLNLVFFAFGIVHAGSRLGPGLSPAPFLAHAIAALSCFAGLALAGVPDVPKTPPGDDARRPRSPKPLTTLLYASLAGTAVPLAGCAAALLAAPLIGSTQVAMAGLAASGVAGVLEDASSRDRLAATTFRRLNLAFAVCATGIAAALWAMLRGGTLAAETVLCGRWVVGMAMPESALRLVAVLCLYGAGLALFEGAKAVLKEKRL